MKLSLMNDIEPVQRIDQLNSLRSNGKVAVVVDSAASPPAEFRDHPLTFTVPMLLHVAGETYRDGVDLTTAEFYRMQREHAGRTITSAPSPGDFLTAFQKASRIAKSVLCITVSSAFSSASTSAAAAVEQFDPRAYGTEVRVLDSESAVGGEGLIAWEALKASVNGADISGAGARAEHIRERISLLAYVDTLYYLWKGGRVPRIAHAAGSLLRLKPVFELRRSEVRKLARPRTAPRAVSRLVELMADRVAGRRIHAAVMHAEDSTGSRSLMNAIDREFDCVELFETEFTPVMGAHIGPGMVGVAFWPED